MYPLLQETSLGELLWTIEPYFHNQTTSAYGGDGSLSHGYEASTSFENYPYDASAASQELKPMIIPSLDYHAIPIDIPSTELMDPYFTPPITTPPTQNLPGYSPSPPSSSSSSPSSSPHSRSPSYSPSSSSSASSWGESTLWTMDSWFPNPMGHGSYYPNVRDQEFSINHDFGYPPNGLNTFGGSLATSPGVSAKAPTPEAMDVRQGQYNVMHSGSLIHHPDLTRHGNGNRIGEPRIYDRRFTCTFNNCGKSFSGEWEKARHIKSIHGPPTIGCRVCSYKQSRKDLFSEHCKKRHPGESIEELMVKLVQKNNGTTP